MPAEYAAWPSWPRFTEEEGDAVRRVLLSNQVNYWTGQEGRQFEQEFASFADSTHGVALANGTVALEAALRAINLQQGDEVIVTPRSFFASVSTVVLEGGTPVFADVDRNSQCLTAETISHSITSRTRAVIVVHLAGWPAAMDEILDVCRQHDVIVIEDCAQAHGARYRGRSVGSIGDMGCWSFCQDKIMTTGGEGGMLTTNDPELWERVWSYKDHGKSWSKVNEVEYEPGYRWLHDSFGTNWRMTEMQAAVGRLQLRLIGEWHARRQSNQRQIWDAAQEIPGLRVPVLPDHAEHAAYKCYLFVESAALKSGWSRDRVKAEIQEASVPCLSGSCPEIYLEKAFEGMSCRPEKRLPVAQELGETSLMLTVHPTLEPEHIDRTIAALRSVMTRAVG